MLTAVMTVAIHPSGADPLPCGDAAVRVDTTNPATHEMICSAVSEARRVIGKCGLIQMAPVEIKTVDALVEPIGHCLASFDCALGMVRIIEPELLIENLPPNDPYANIPADLVFRSLLTHELAHAFVYQQSGDRKISPVDHEYIANALGLAALPELYRQTFLDSIGIEPPVSSGSIDIFIYALDPRRFAAVSYLYYEGEGCQTILGILDGTSSFRTEW
jgi:hypothetical protein